jgi:hypothetical protein
MKWFISIMLVVIVVILTTTMALVWRFERAYTDAPQTVSTVSDGGGHPGQGLPTDLCRRARLQAGLDPSACGP